MPTDTVAQHTLEVQLGKRFEFGANWAKFLSVVGEDRILAAEKSLADMLPVPIEGKRFLDIGSGSGLFSLAARRLGANVHSFDYDPQSVACTQEMRRRFSPDERYWTVQQGSVLDSNFLSSLGKFDVVYSWGVLHHTGAMWQALENAGNMVAEGGILIVAIYNDQGKISRRWKRLKKAYCEASRPLKFGLAVGTCVVSWWRRWLKDLLLLHPFRTWREASARRGMSAWYDVVDWVGGYPFEVAKPEEIFRFFRKRGFQLELMRTEGKDLGCNEFVFTKTT
jgi:2-polyprenyl-6-hydroxyphenyl methylase/3-demethylubiquinone-9 3-methyltransferase